jgi:hypothetical protein
MAERSERINVAVTAVMGNGHVELREVFVIPEGTLDGVLAVLTRFHELAERIRDEQAGVSKR